MTILAIQRIKVCEKFCLIIGHSIVSIEKKAKINSCEKLKLWIVNWDECDHG